MPKIRILKPPPGSHLKVDEVLDIDGPVSETVHEWLLSGIAELVLEEEARDPDDKASDPTIH